MIRISIWAAALEYQIAAAAWSRAASAARPAQYAARDRLIGNLTASPMRTK